MEDLFIELKHNTKTDKFEMSTNLKEERIEEFISEYLRLQMGTGADPSPPDERDEYTIHVGLDLSDDTFSVSSNCGNKSLREGIIMEYLSRIRKEKGSWEQ